MALRRRKARLCRRRAAAPKRAADRNPKMPPEIESLVETTRSTTRRVERHRNDRSRSLEHIRASSPQHRAKRGGKRPPAVVFQRVNDCAQRALVRAYRPRPIDEATRAPTARASRERHADDTPRRQRIPARVAKRRREWKNRSPAGVANRTARRMIEQFLARRARWGQDDREDGIERHAYVGRVLWTRRD